MNNFLLTIAAFLVLILAALFGVPPLINWNDYRGAFEEEASRLLDREVRVRGEVSVRILPIPHVSFEKVRIADAPGVPGSFARAERFKMWLSVPPLLRGVFEAREIELVQPVIRLRTEADGSGNWRKLQISESDLAFIPRDVALKSVLIRDATLRFESHHGHEIATLSKITGEMMASALNGPYKFIGTMPFGDQPDAVPQEIRLSTARMEDNGNVLFNGSVRSPDGRTVHSVNGTLSDLLGRARASGRVTSRSRPPRDATTKVQGAGYELAADLKLDAKALRLDKIAITFQHQKRQQTLSGSTITRWQDGVSTQTVLTTSWLDLDAIAGATATDGPLKAVERLLTRGIEPLGAGVTSLDLSIDQANLAGTAISDLRGRMIRRDGVTKIEALRASLPGLTALAIDGFLERRQGGIQFDGNVLLRTASFSEFAQWGGLKLAKPSARALATSFLLDGNVRIRPQSWELSDARVSLGTAHAEGAIGYTWSARPSLVATIDANDLTLENFGTDLLSPSRIASYLGLPLAPGPKGSGKPANDNHARKWLRDVDIALRLRSGSASDGRHSFADIDIDLRRSGDTLHLTKFDLTLQPGLKLALSGKLLDLAQEVRGGITGTVAAANDAAGTRLADLLSLVARTDVPPQLIAGRTPLRVAVDAKLGTAASSTNPSPPINHVIADGTIGNDRIRVDARTFGPIGTWRTQPADVQARISGSNALDTTRWLIGKPMIAASAAAPKPSIAHRDASPATIVMTAAGTPDKKMKTFLRVAAGKALDADFSGDVVLTDTRTEWSGFVDLRRATAKTVALLTWPDLHGHLSAVPVSGRIKVSSVASGHRFEPQPLQIGPTRVTGKLELASGSDRPRLSGNLALDKASLPRLADLLMRTTSAPTQRPTAQPQTVDTPWPETPFDVSHLAAVDAEIDVKVQSLALGGAREPLNNATFRTTISPAKVAISEFSARAGKAILTAQAGFEKSQAGAMVSAKLSGKGIELGRWAPALARSNRLTGTAEIDISVRGRALSPRSLSTALEGTGEVRLTGVRVPGLTSETITVAARKVIDGETETEALGGLLTGFAAEGFVELGAPVLKLRIANGTLAFPAVVFDQDAGGLRNDTFIDLPRLRIDSRWTVTPAPQPRPDSPEETVALPPITVVYAGTIAEISRIEPKIDLGDLERELIVRKMEANVARLERLRREDEARAAAEAERQRLIEEEQRRAIEAERLRRVDEEKRRAEEALRSGDAPPQPPGAAIDGNPAPITAPQSPQRLSPPQQAAANSPDATGAQRSSAGLLRQPAPKPRQQPRRPRRPPVKKKFNPFSND